MTLLIIYPCNCSFPRFFLKALTDICVLHLILKQKATVSFSFNTLTLLLYEPHSPPTHTQSVCYFFPEPAHTLAYIKMLLKPIMC